MNLRYDLQSADEAGEKRHAQVAMKALGITYQHSTPQSIGDQWWFWNCENVPHPLPPYLSILDAKPWECVGYGLSRDDAYKLDPAGAPRSDYGAPHGRWHVQTKGDLTGCEISIIREDFKHGHDSWGWDSPDAKIIFVNAGAKYEPLTEDKWKRWHEMAEAMAKALNDREAENGEVGI
jgi:hypothetical protein